MGQLGLGSLRRGGGSKLSLWAWLAKTGGSAQVLLAVAAVWVLLLLKFRPTSTTTVSNLDQTHLNNNDLQLQQVNANQDRLNLKGSNANTKACNLDGSFEPLVEIVIDYKKSTALTRVPWCM